MEPKIVEKYEDLAPEQKIMISEVQFKVIRETASDLASKMNCYWLQQLINQLKIQLFVKREARKKELESKKQ